MKTNKKIPVSMSELARLMNTSRQRLHQHLKKHGDLRLFGKIPRGRPRIKSTPSLSGEGMDLSVRDYAEKEGLKTPLVYYKFKAGLLDYRLEGEKNNKHLVIIGNGNE